MVQHDYEAGRLALPSLKLKICKLYPFWKAALLRIPKDSVGRDNGISHELMLTGCR
jgi:hypothetical protein